MGPSARKMRGRRAGGMRASGLSVFLAKPSQKLALLVLFVLATPIGRFGLFRQSKRHLVISLGAAILEFDVTAAASFSVHHVDGDRAAIFERYIHDNTLD